MYFIGSGALLYHAADYALASGLKVAGICCPPGDPATPKLRNRGMAVVQSHDPNEEMLPLMEAGGIVFSINNKQILGDELLSAGAKFFNVHNGLVQKYRGIAEVCIFAALCRGENRYGVTLQQLLPRQKVDTGPVVAQIEFPIGEADCFSDVLQHSLDACRRIFESNVRNIASNSYDTAVLETAPSALTYRDVASLYAQADPSHRTRAAQLGRYSGFFPKLRALIQSAQTARSPA
jgi:methionyl-tRNA formyltransferase